MEFKSKVEEALIPKAELHLKAPVFLRPKSNKKKEIKPSNLIETVLKADIGFEIVNRQGIRSSEKRDAKTLDSKKEKPKADSSIKEEQEEKELKPSSIRDIDLPKKKPKSMKPKISSAKKAKVKEKESKALGSKDKKPKISEFNDKESQEEELKVKDVE